MFASRLRSVVQLSLLIALFSPHARALALPRASSSRSRGRAAASRGSAGRGTPRRDPFRSREYEPFDEFEPRADRDRRRRPAPTSDDSPTPAPSRGGPYAPPPPKVWEAEAAASAAGFFSEASFEALGATPELAAALRACGAERPSHVQAIGFKPVFRGEDVVLADQTGSGKTLAYLAPLVMRLRKQELEEGRTPSGRVRALVVVPTSELAQQVLAVAKALSAAGARFRSTIITGEHKWATQRKCAENGMELIVATPGRLASHLQTDQGPSFSLDSLQSLVLDEADLLFEDEGFDEIWAALRERVPASSNTVFVTATLAPWVVSAIQRDLPLVKLLKGKTLHKTGAGVKEKLIDCSAGVKQKNDDISQAFERKLMALQTELKEQPAARTLVFCNTIESCRRVENSLRRADRRGATYEVLPFHGAIPAEARKRTLAEFTSDSSRGVPKVLVATDRASRGMDFVDVSHVVLFDFPRDGVEYLRRVGRVTRGAQSPGHVTSLVLGRQLMYARTLMKINREGGTIDLETHGSLAER
ncbi:hypothetical protein AB1Y20_004494 [Prymnesium parvum]|uniref:RNA helicase n=1 Tax=Prymnesium parvum TaxID=97485 RepID=A0AB34IZE0_PRYPA